jgi:hypothetical protein
MVILVIAVVAIIAVVAYVSFGHKGTVKPVQPTPSAPNNMSGFQQPHANPTPGKKPVRVTPAPVHYVKQSPKQNKKAAKKYNGRSF